MKYTKNKYYHSVTGLDGIETQGLDFSHCPICGDPIRSDYIDFRINERPVRVCTHECMVRIKNIYNYLKS